MTPNLEISRSRKKPIKDILAWTQCFTVYMAVLAKAEPDCITELAAYMLTIITAAQDYEHPAWERYDRAYRDKAAATRNKMWSQIDPALFNQMFTGRVKHLVPGLYLEHETAGPYTTVWNRQAHEPSYMPSIGPTPKRWRPNEDTICLLYNKGNCTFKHCKFRHICSQRGCGGHHPAVSCPQIPKLTAYRLK